MRIAVASQNFRTVTGHAGKTRRFLIFEATPDQPAKEVGRLDMPKEMSLHEFRGAGEHPLFAMDAIIAGSAGPGFIRRMAAQGVIACTTSETDPVVAACALAEGKLPAALPDIHDHAAGGHGCSCA
ncbi:NifB/NifX family molybdenum-iron cluster-binding protein [Aliiruegeria sabulilitoris]|uniref:NifB/NifX family molybdenum-iron cluster-binding protein n=1 Tax=Aliiruegeria sabulilitoris TaxID=1510458 RepID=UPI00082C2C1B|nr:nitrogen fixation protein [Aliiruegeria sabulilitoris]NDR59534.1 nitrogen fixation protein [Pseudoruegeria sp. M32A2M]